MTDSPLPAGEQPDTELEERRTYRVLASGKRFKYDIDGSVPAYAYTSGSDGKTWQRGGQLMAYRGPIQGLSNASIQMESLAHRGRIVLPFYMGMLGEHPDYTRAERGGYALYNGEKILLETHTHVPEMAGSFMVYSDDEGESWSMSQGFLMGYFQDGHMGFMPGDEPVLVELSDGRVLCYMRSTCGCIIESTSSDSAQNWSKVQPTGLAASNSPCALARIPGSDDLLLIWNQVSADEIRRGYRRGRLSLAISHDDARTWGRFKTLERVSTLSEQTRIEPPPLTSMVRGPSGPDNHLGEIPSDMRHYGYPEIYFHDNVVSICYKQNAPKSPQPIKWCTHPISWLYE